ncbi:uncharacterized protein LOC129613225 [Condylostylus longicornis]|uniref:uncharacterized protein LOC129613225 n=1 Tax=Condylostylus longicornis TaxID=2530218 RepID=UPI00244DEA83|nr:uncharacterized protein LOC129613225 [Condylostylus longicornis]
MEEQNSYEYQCMRAELLGLEKPDKEAFDLEQQKLREQELRDVELAEALSVESESCEKTKGKLDELNTLLSRTQQKINTFTGSPVKTLTRMFSKQKIEADEPNDLPKKDNNINGNDVADNTGSLNLQSTQCATSSNIMNQECKTRSMEIDKKMSSHLDKLDELINKAEKADMSMAHQNKQMKKFINK